MPQRRKTGQPGRAVAYIRVSTEDQRLGPEAQRAAIEAWARGAGVAVVAWHSDHGVSGARELDDRPELKAAIVSLRAHDAGLLVVAKRDRLARDVMVAAVVQRAVEKAGARVVSADGTGNGDSPADSFMRTVLDGAAAYERELIRARTKAALRAKRARGERAGTVPFGYAVDAAGRLAPQPGEQATIARVCMLRAGGCSLRTIVAELEREGVVSRVGKPLRLTQVAVILRNVGRADASAG